MTLSLPNDGAITASSLAEHLASADPALAAVVLAIAAAAVPVAERLRLGGLPGDPTEIVGTNETGDQQKALDVATHDHFVAALRGHDVRMILSEEAETEVPVDPDGRFDVAMDPIDGSGSIGIGAPLGTLFCVFPAGGFLRSGREVVAAGYVSFGHSVDLGVSLGDGVLLATLDAGGTFRVTNPRVALPLQTQTVAFNASYVPRFAPDMQRYVADCMAGKTGPRAKTFNMRWMAAAVGDLHRIMVRGGVFMYPADTRPGYGEGHLRICYEAFPIAFLMEQAGGAATDGETAILDLIPATLHAKTPLVFGSRGEIDVLQSYLSRP